MTVKELGVKMLCRAYWLGVLAGLSASVGHLVLVGIHAVVGQSGSSVYLGGSAQIINGVPRVELPHFVLYVSLLGMVPWSILLARVVSINHRPAWWKVAPLMWGSLGAMLLASYIFAPQFDKYYNYLVPCVGYLFFGLLFGLMLRSFKATLILAFAAPGTYVLALFLEALFPTTFLVTVLTGYPPTHISFLHTQEALQQAVTWAFHGAALGVAICVIEDRIRERYDLLRKGL